MNIFIGTQELTSFKNEVNGKIIEFENEEYYLIENYDQMDPFFMSIVSSSDHWMFISSTGGVTAGRKNPDNAIFPYYTDDKIHETSETTGSKTILLVNTSNKTYLWEPFSDKYKGIYKIKRNLYKNSVGNKIVFEEKNEDLLITFRYSWQNSDKFGWIKKSELINKNKTNINVKIMDGLQNILPYGVEKTIQETKSTLLDGYKKCELIKEVNLGLFRLSSIPVDRAEPSEALKVNTVWAVVPETIKGEKILLSNQQLNNFRKGLEISEESETRGIKGAFFLNFETTLKENQNDQWYFTAETGSDHSKISELINYLKTNKQLINSINKSIEESQEELISLVGQADGIQHTGDKLNDKRHFSNVIFNIMRGGIFNNDYLIEKSDFIKHIKTFNKIVFEKNSDKLENLPDELNYSDLLETIESWDSPQLLRITLEYLPLTFSRRHGDPSRPWNMFDIKIKNDDGTPSLSYQGNWRDIFQNWEALAMSYPEFIPGMIAKFLNASTIDGYNPYRITREGIDWEVHDPSDPWSNIGYWGDHQIIYLLKLLELSEKFYPGELNKWFDKSIFAYANVPYKIKNYDELLNNPQDTIIFDSELEDSINENLSKIGSDAKLILNPHSYEVSLVNFTEKIMSTLLSKMSNFIPEAGIWMNTQRPEWNDANNALVGYGVSMVTLYYIRRFAEFSIKLFENSDVTSIKISRDLKEFSNKIFNTLNFNKEFLNDHISDETRKRITDQLGNAGSEYRSKVYEEFSNLKEDYNLSEFVQLLKLIIQYTDHSIEANKYENGLYHAYNILSIKENKFEIKRLYDMLEGQVAVLSSGKLTSEEVLKLVKSLYESELYRADQDSFILYPDKKLPMFLEKNIIPKTVLNTSKLLTKLISDDNKDIIVMDSDWNYHFNGNFNNSNYLKEALNKLNDYKELVELEKQSIIDIYEDIFNHKSFTGRSGTFYKYEGLGCIYWHMVSKLLLTVGENIINAEKSGTSKEILDELKEYYYRIKDGIGVHKNPKDYGAFPTDPYSHTPSMSGVQQPGMTGQVKEDILSRFNELGVSIQSGKLCFNPLLLTEDMFTPNQNEIHFLYCGVPIIYSLGNKTQVTIIKNNHNVKETKIQENLTLDTSLSQRIFSRDNSIESIEVVLKK